MIALYPGAFKPPHRGHFEVVKRLLKGNHGGHVYSIDNYQDVGAKALSGKEGKVDKINKVIVFPGGGERNGITKGEAIAIWQMYAKYLPGLEVMDGQKNPMFAAKDYAKANTEDKFYAITGVRDESDFSDLKRITTFKNTPHVEGLMITSNEGDSVRASDLRNAALKGSLDDIIDFFPKELNREELFKIMRMLKDNIIAEAMNQKIENLFEEMFTTNEENRYNKDGYDEGDIKLMGDYILPIDKMVVLQAEEDTYNRGLLVTNNKDKSYDVAYWADDKTKPYPIGIEIDGKEVAKDAKIIKFLFHPEMKETADPQDGKAAPYGSGYKKVEELELKDYITSLVEYMLDKKMNITPLPEIKIRHDEDNSKNFFGRTAYYDPNVKEIVLFVDGRHNKDIVRSFSHEMVHHIQNLEGRLQNIQTTNTNEDSNLLEIEAEAYMQGNITFRNWEDSLKNKNESLWANINAKRKSGRKKSHGNSKAYKAAKKAGKALTKSKKAKMNEASYDKLSNKVSSAIFASFKEALVKGEDGEFMLTVGPQEDADIKSNMTFDIQAVVKITDDVYSVDGGANAGYDDDGDEIDPFINIVFQIPKNVNLKELSFDLKDVVRHEIEHLTQDGENLKQGKYIPDDKELRDLIDAGLLDKDEYYKLPKEVDAMIQGMYFKAKKSKTPFVDVVDDYFERAKVTPEERPKIKALWNKRLPALGIKQRL